MSVVAMPVGSAPFTDPGQACDLVFQYFPDVPGWPQLPRRDWRELMVNQFLEGVPGIRFEADGRAMWDGDPLTPTLSPNGGEGSRVRGDVSPDFAAGLHQFLTDCRAGRAAGARAVKGQVVGPVTLAWNLRDSEGEPIIRRPGALEWAANVVSAKARWQIRALRESSGKPVVMVVDEPTLAVLKSPLLDLPRESVAGALRLVSGAIRAEQATAGLHCCGKTDWSLLLPCGFDLVNFDGYEFFEGVLPHAAAFAGFVEAGGRIAWGVVPTTPKIHDETAASLLARWRGQVESLARAGTARDQDRRDFQSRLLEDVCLTPSCGVGGLPEDWAEKVFQMASGLAQSVHQT